jgi:hypothetical protein
MMLHVPFYPIWVRGPRPAHFPEAPEIDRLLDSNFDPRLDHIKVRMKRRNARALRKGILGPKGVRRVPGKSGGVKELALPNGWTLRLTYYAAGGYDFERRRAKAGEVDAEFIPPRLQRRFGFVQEGTALAA